MYSLSGMKPGRDWDNMFRRYIAMGLDKEITQMAITSCIDCENKSYMESVAHTKHAELKNRIQHFSMLSTHR